MSLDNKNQKIYEDIYASEQELLKYPDEILVSYLYNSMKPDRSIKSIVDVGFGSGRHVILFAREGYDVSGIESSKSALIFTKKRIENEKLDAKLKVGSSFQIDFKDNAFDALLCWGVINCVVGDKELDKTMNEFKRVLRPNGKLLISLMSPKDVKYKEAKLVKNNLYRINYQNKEIYNRFWNKGDALNFINKYNFSIEKIGFVLRNVNFDENIPIAYHTVAATNQK